MGNGIIVPSDIKDSGTTNKYSITWERQGNVVSVGIYGYDLDGTNTDITGIPAPKGGQYLLSLIMTGNTIGGYIQYSGNKWNVTSLLSSGQGFGSITFVTE